MSDKDNYPGLSGARVTLEVWLQAAKALGEDRELRDLLAGLLEQQVTTSSKLESDLPGRFGMIGASPAMERLFGMLERVAKSDVPVLIHGETGSGKELVARGLHDFGLRAGEAFLAENCAAVAPNLLESELFGHVRGAFTDAVRDRKGTFLAADGGTVFLDEIGDMPLDMQAKILRVLQEGEIRPVGSSKPKKVNVRVVAASHRDLVSMVKAGSFREDLFYRLNVITLEVPALRERQEDVPLLAEFLLRRIAKEEDAAPRVLTPAAIEALVAMPFPGNVRELENLLRRAAALTSPNQPIDASDLVG